MDKAKAYDYQTFIEALSSLTDEHLEKMINHGVQMCRHVTKPGHLVYVPTGWAGVEKVPTGQNLVYGFRKSFLQKNSEAENAYRVCTSLFDRAKRNTDRMQAVLKVMAPAKPAGDAAPAKPAGD